MVIACHMHSRGTVIGQCDISWLEHFLKAIKDKCC